MTVFVAAFIAAFIAIARGIAIPILLMEGLAGIARLRAFACKFLLDLFILIGTIAKIALLALLAFLALLGGHEQAIIVLCVLIKVFSGNPVAGGNRIARKLLVFFTDMSRGTTDLHIRTIAVITAIR